MNFDKYLIKNGTIITLGDQNKIIEDGAIYIEGEIIKDVGKTSELEAKYKGIKLVDALGKIVLPGMINTHMHLYSTFACGISAEPAINFVEILEKLWWKLDKALLMEDVYYSSLIPLIKCVKAGTTTIIDHHASPKAIKGSLFKIGEAVNNIGLRANLCYEVTDRGGEKEMEEGIEENVEFIKECKEKNYSNLSGLFGLHASLTISEKTLLKCIEEAKKLDCGFHVHVAEDLADVEDSLKKYNKRVVERYKEAGVLSSKTCAAHCVHINEKEMEILKETETNVVHNPQSNMNNAVGCADILKMLKMGITVGLGTDGMTSNMFDEMRVATLIHRHVKHDPRVAFVEAVELLTKNNAKIASKYFSNPVGEIKKGAFADIIFVDYNPFTPFTIDNFYGHFMFGIAPSQVDTTIVGGKILMSEKKLIGINEKEIAKRAKELAREVWKRF